MPAMGLGVWKIPQAQAAEAVYTALKLGWRAIDAACDYGNEAQVGEGIARAIAEGVCTRKDLFITSKLWCTFHEPSVVEGALRRTLADLQLDYLDLYLIHFPIPLRFVDPAIRYPPGWFFDPSSASPAMEWSRVPVSDTWAALEVCADKGLARALGVCNFNTSLLRDLTFRARRPVEVLQVELHPYLVQEKLVRFAQAEGVVVTGFSPLGSASYVEIGMAAPTDSALLEPVVRAIAERLGVTPAQVILAWHLARGLTVVPKSVNPARMAENLGAEKVVGKLTAEDVAAISALDKHKRFVSFSWRACLAQPTSTAPWATTITPHPNSTRKRMTLACFAKRLSTHSPPSMIKQVFGSLLCLLSSSFMQSTLF
jgi:D-xylose reductase